MRIRTVKPSFWSHPVLSKLSDTAQLLAIALLNYSDDEGYFEADVQLVRSALRPRDADGAKTYRALQDLAGAGYIELREHVERGPLGRVVNFTEHQVISRATASKIRGYWQKAPGADLAALPAGSTPVKSLPMNATRAPGDLFELATAPAAKADEVQAVEAAVMPKSDKAAREPATSNGGIFAAYNEVAARVGWARVDMKRGVTADRKDGAKRLWMHLKDEGDHFARMAAVREFFEMAGRIPFYLGETGGRTWKADFNFLTKAKNIPQVREKFEALFGVGAKVAGAGAASQEKSLREREADTRRVMEEEDAAPDWIVPAKA